MRVPPMLLVTAAALAVVAPAAPRAVECEDPSIALDLLGTSTSGDAFAIREVLLGEGEGEACPYPSVKGRCTAAVTLHVCRAGGKCDAFVVYAEIPSAAEGGRPGRPTPQAEAERSLAAAKRAMAEARIAPAEGTPLRSAADPDTLVLAAAELKAFADLGPVELRFGAPSQEVRDARRSKLPEASLSPGELAAELADGTAIVLGVSGFHGDAGWVRGEAAVFLSGDRTQLVHVFHSECGSGEVRPFLMPVRGLAARLLNARGYRRYLAGDAAGAVKDLSRAVEADPELVMARCNLGLALVKAGRAEEGAAALGEALRRGDASGKTPTSCR